MRKPLVIALVLGALVYAASRPKTRAFARQKFGTGRQLMFQAVGRARTAVGLPARQAS